MGSSDGDGVKLRSSSASRASRSRRTWNSNVVVLRMPDSSAFRYADAFEAMRHRLMALPDVARLHYLCCADHMAAICAKAGRRPEDEPRWQGFMAQAAAAP